MADEPRFAKPVGIEDRHAERAGDQLAVVLGEHLGGRADHLQAAALERGQIDPLARPISVISRRLFG